MRKVVTVLCMLALVLAGCGQGQKYGPDRFNPVEGEGGDFRFETPTPLPVEDEPQGALDAGAVTPVPQATAAPTPPPQVNYFDVELVADSPYFKPGNALVMSSASVLRVVNKDTTPERKCRSFTDKGQRFSSGCLAPGAKWEHRFGPGTSGRFEIIDQGLTFATATLEVR